MKNILFFALFFVFTASAQRLDTVIMDNKMIEVLFDKKDSVVIKYINLLHKDIDCEYVYNYDGTFAKRHVFFVQNTTPEKTYSLLFRNKLNAWEKIIDIHGDAPKVTIDRYGDMVIFFEKSTKNHAKGFYKIVEFPVLVEHNLWYYNRKLIR